MDNYNAIAIKELPKNVDEIFRCLITIKKYVVQLRANIIGLMKEGILKEDGVSLLADLELIECEVDYYLEN
jgi:hypothetical protein